MADPGETVAGILSASDADDWRRTLGTAVRILQEALDADCVDHHHLARAAIAAAAVNDAALALLGLDDGVPSVADNLH